MKAANLQQMQIKRKELKKQQINIMNIKNGTTPTKCNHNVKISSLLLTLIVHAYENMKHMSVGI